MTVRSQQTALVEATKIEVDTVQAAATDAASLDSGIDANSASAQQKDVKGGGEEHSCQDGRQALSKNGYQAPKQSSNKENGQF